MALLWFASAGRARAAVPDWLPPERLSAGGLSLLAPANVRDPAPPRRALRSVLNSASLDRPVGEDPEALPPGQRAQAEPHLARSFTDPGWLLATFQEGRFADGGAVTCGYAVSHDGGASWTRALLPGLVRSVDGGPFDRASDPVAAVGADDTCFLSTLGLRGEAPNWLTAITLHRSHDGGRTFEPPLIVIESTNRNLFLDKNWLAVNTFSETPTAGRLVITLTRFFLSPVHGLTHPIAVTFSDDQGETWSELELISSDNCQGSQPVFLPDGSLAVAWWVFDGADRGHLRVRHSPVGGETFGPIRDVATVTPYRDPVARSAQFLPSLATDRTLGGLYLVWQGRTDAPRVWFSHSRDQGRTWSPPVAVNDTPGGRSVFNPIVAVSPDGQHVTVIFYDKRNDDGSGHFVDLYLAESFDGGGTWAANRRISSVSSDLTRAPLTISGRMLGDYQGLVPALNRDVPGLALWVDARSETLDPWCAPIARTQGASFAAWQWLAFADPAAPEARPEADADRDGQPNWVEYLVGHSPRRVDPPALRATTPVSPGAPPAYTFRTQAVVDDLAPTWLQSADLLHWDPVAPATLTPAPGPPAFRHWTVTFAPVTPGGGFFRLGAREP